MSPRDLSKEDAHFLATGSELGEGDEPDEQDQAEDQDEAEPVVEARPAKTKAKTEEPAAQDTKPKDEKAEKAEKAKPPEGFVEKGALEAERNRRRQLEAENRRIEREAAERFARLEERLSLIQKAREPEEQPESIDPREDPYGAIQQVIPRLSAIEQHFARSQQMTEQERAQARARAEVENRYRADAQTYRQENPQFQDAYSFLINSRAQELSVLPQFRNNPAAIAEAVRNDELQIAYAALQNGDSPAEVLFNLAQARGWQPKQAEPPPQQRQSANGNGQQTAPSGAEQVKRLAAAKEASTSLSQAGGAAGGNKITLDDLDKMSNEELDNFIRARNKKDPHGFDKWMRSQMVGTA